MWAGGKGERRLEVGEGEREMSRGQLMSGLGCQAQVLAFETRVGFIHNES